MSLDCFHRDISKRLGVASRCKECVQHYDRQYRIDNRDVLLTKDKQRHVGERRAHTNAIQRRSYANNRAAGIARARVYYQKHPEYERNYRLYKKYRVTAAQWDVMFGRQGGLCAICKTSLNKAGSVPGKRADVVDHDHQTGRVRGLVCHHCNQHRIGTNTVETVKSLLMYLQSSFDGRGL